MQNAGATQTEKVTITFFSGSLDLMHKDGRRAGRTHKLTADKFSKTFCLQISTSTHCQLDVSSIQYLVCRSRCQLARKYGFVDRERDASNTRTLSLRYCNSSRLFHRVSPFIHRRPRSRHREKIERHRHQHEIYYGKYETFTIHVELVSVKR